MSLCLAAGALVVELGVNAATLSWVHSVEKTIWEEDWGETPQGLIIEEARVQGSGAGMEPPPQARLERGTWRWRPVMVPLPQVVLRRSGATADWRICMKGKCRPMGDFVSGEADPVILRACGAASQSR